jgi:hypothetical protein
LLARVLTMLAVAIVLVSGSGCCRTCPPDKATTLPGADKVQTKCPVMGGEINKSLFTDVKGCRVYVCCAGCIPAIQKEPDKYLEKIKANGEVPERVKPVPVASAGEGK